MDDAERESSIIDIRKASGEPNLSYSREAEQSLLGALLLDNAAHKRVASMIRADSFREENHQIIYAHIAGLIEANGAADIVTVAEALERAGKLDAVGGPAYLGALAQNTPSALNIQSYARAVVDRAKRRALEAIGRNLIDRATKAGSNPEELWRDAKATMDGLSSPARDDPSGWPEPIDLSALASSDPPRPRHIIADWLPAGEVTLFAGHGGSGKSLIALHLAACLALGRPWWGDLPVEQKRVLYISAEDAMPVLTWRMSRIASYLGVTIADLAPSLRLIDASDREAELMIDPGRGDAPILTALYDALAKLMSEYDVLILDGASDLYGASEIIRRHVRRFLRMVRRLVRPDGAAVLLAHLDKAAARDSGASDRYSGSTAWNNSVRSRWALGSEDETLTLTLAKANHAPKGAEFRLRWDAQAHLYVADPVPTDGGVVGAIRERVEGEAILAALRACSDVPAATTGPRTAWHVLSARPEFPAALREGRDARRKFWRAIERLRAMGAVREDAIRRADRHYTRVLVASPIEAAGDAGNA